MKDKAKAKKAKRALAFFLWSDFSRQARAKISSQLGKEEGMRKVLGILVAGILLSPSVAANAYYAQCEELEWMQESIDLYISGNIPTSEALADAIRLVAGFEDDLIFTGCGKFDEPPECVGLRLEVDGWYALINDLRANRADFPEVLRWRTQVRELATSRDCS